MSIRFAVPGGYQAGRWMNSGTMSREAPEIVSLAWLPEIVGMRAVLEPALEPHAAFQPRDSRALRRPLRHVAAQRLGVNEAQMRQVEQIVVDELIVRRVVEMAGLDVPIGIGRGDGIRDQRAVRHRGPTHPHPYPTAAFDDRKASHGSGLRDERLSRNLDAASVRGELHAVIHAAQIVLLQASLRQGCEPVTAAVFQRNDRAVGLPVQYQWLVDDRAGQQRVAGDIIRPRGHVTGIADPHGPSLAYCSLGRSATATS
jgi:hypothetical protein